MRKHGGIYFVKVWRLRLTFCVVK